MIFINPGIPSVNKNILPRKREKKYLRRKNRMYARESFIIWDESQKKHR
jgi:hypothetical protein